METYQCLMLEIEGKNKMSIWDDIKKAAKGSKEYQEGRKKAKQAKVDKLAKQRDTAKSKGKYSKQARKQNKINKKLGKKAATPSGKHKGKELKAKAEKDASWKKASKARKGKTSMNELIKARNAAKASGDKAAYAAAQNKINKAYGSKKVHKADAPKKASPKKASPKKLDVTDIVKNVAKSKPKAKVDVTDRVKAVDKKMSSERWAGMSSEEKGAWKDRQRGGAKKMETGGKVEGCGEAGGGMFNWPSTDSRKR